MSAPHVTPHVERVDVAVVGSGFAGSLFAMALARRGRRVALIERGRHPRFAIGESSTPLANLLLEELADGYDLPELRALSKWGTWQRAHPDVPAGLKRGFTFLFHEPGKAFDFAGDGQHRRELLVAASPNDEVADTHWYRPAFDHVLVQLAQAREVLYYDETRIDRVDDHGRDVTLDADRQGRPLRFVARFVVDASGARGLFHRLSGEPDRPLRWLPDTHALFTHFEDVGRWDDLAPTTETPPYPRDDAALHHVFPGGWIWVLRFNNGITSAGAALTTPIANKIDAAEGAPAWERLLESLPSVREQFRGARATRPFIHMPRLAFRSNAVTGQNWAALPSAVGIIDPLLSTGFPQTLLGIQRLLTIVEDITEGDASKRAVIEGGREALAAYARTTQIELDATERLVAALYAHMDDIPLFKRLSLLYFAVASYSEAVRRLGRPELAPGFLLTGHPTFAAQLEACTDVALGLRGSSERSSAGQARERRRAQLLSQIDQAIEPFDTAGLLDASRRDWYPVQPRDLIASAGKLHASESEVQRLLERCGFAATPAAQKG